MKQKEFFSKAVSDMDGLFEGSLKYDSTKAFTT